MFSSTLQQTDAFLHNICCNKCQQPCDKLQFIGSSCKHVFCWTCINEICDEKKSFPLCPHCSLPVGMQHVTEATFASQLFQNLLTLKDALTEFDVSQIDRKAMLDLIEPEKQRRTVEEFCLTQQKLDAKDGNNDDNSLKANAVNSGLAAEKAKPKRASVSNDESLGPLPISDDVTPFTQPDDSNVTGTSGMPKMSQPMRIYKEPENFQFFKKPPINTFAKVTAEGTKSGSDRKTKSTEREAKKQNIEREAEKQNTEELNFIPSSVVSPSNSHRSPSQRYECSLVNAAIRCSESKLLHALNNGDDANDCDNLGLTALYHAASRNAIQICKILIENGALINAHGGELCETALHAAVRWRAVDAVEYLLTRGANRRAFNLKGETPMDLITDDTVRNVFNKVSHCVQIVYPSRKLKRYSVFLSATLTSTQLVQGRRFFNQLTKDATNFETATHLIVPATENQATELTVEILEAMLRGQYVLSSEWLDRCLKANDILDEEKYEIRSVHRDGQLIAENSCSVARKNHAKMKPELFRGCQFYFCKHKYMPYRDRDLKRLIQLGGGLLLTREPNAEEYIESGMKPYHAYIAGNKRDQLSGLFAVYMPGQFMPRRVIQQKFINLVTPLWIMDCIAKFTLLRPEDR